MPIINQTVRIEIPHCIIPNCGHVQALALGRGLCMKCYSLAKNLVKAGTKTWEQLEELGLALPKGGVAKDDPFTQALKERDK